jgi:hypothetical protein
MTWYWRGVCVIPKSGSIKYRDIVGHHGCIFLVTLEVWNLNEFIISMDGLSLVLHGRGLEGCETTYRD